MFHRTSLKRRFQFDVGSANGSCARGFSRSPLRIRLTGTRRRTTEPFSMTRIRFRFFLKSRFAIPVVLRPLPPRYFGLPRSDFLCPRPGFRSPYRATRAARLILLFFFRVLMKSPINFEPLGVRSEALSRPLTESKCCNWRVCSGGRQWKTKIPTEFWHRIAVGKRDNKPD
jgi:hypothetical protein